MDRDTIMLFVAGVLMIFSIVAVLMGFDRKHWRVLWLVLALIAMVISVALVAIILAIPPPY